MISAAADAWASGHQTYAKLKSVYGSAWHVLTGSGLANRLPFLAPPSTCLN